MKREGKWAMLRAVLRKAVSRAESWAKASWGLVGYSSHKAVLSALICSSSLDFLCMLRTSHLSYSNKTVFPLSLIRTRTSLFFPTSQSTKGEVSCLPWALPVAEQIELELCALPRRRKFSGACWEASRATPLFCGWCCTPQGHSCWGTCLHLQTQSEWQLPIFQLGRLRAGTGKTRVFWRAWTVGSCTPILLERSQRSHLYLWVKPAALKQDM